MNLHPEPALLSAFLDQALNAAERQALNQHLAGCERCRLGLRRLEESKQWLAHLPPPPVPDDLLPRLARIAVPWWHLPKVKIWIPAGALAMSLLAVMVWEVQRPQVEEGIPIGILAAAHSRYEAESLVPLEDLSSPNFTAELAADLEEEGYAI